MIHVSWIIMLYTLNLYRFLCQLYLEKTERKNPKYIFTAFYEYVYTSFHCSSLFGIVNSSYCLVSFYSTWSLSLVLLVGQFCHWPILYFFVSFGNVIISPLFLKYSFADYRLLSWLFFLLKLNNVISLSSNLCCCWSEVTC